MESVIGELYMSYFKDQDYDVKWPDIKELPSKTFVCFNCGKEIAANKGYRSLGVNISTGRSHIYICYHCCAPNVFDVTGNPIIMPKIGKEIANLPENVSNLYNEVRACLQAGAFTAAAMLMRKMLMDIAVAEGIKNCSTFAQCVEELCKEGIVPKKARFLAEAVRKLGNEVNHELQTAKPEETYALFKFMEMLLEVNYEFAEK